MGTPRFSDPVKPKPVSLVDVVKEFGLEERTCDIDFSNVFITSPSINRPGLQFAGIYDYFYPDRIQILGYAEYYYLMSHNQSEKSRILTEFFKRNVACIVITRQLQPCADMLILAEIHGIAVFTTDSPTSEFVGEMIRYLRIRLAPSIIIHGCLVDIYGEGVVIMGDSGVGKSETALELVKRGHRLAADDAIEISKISASTLIGKCPSMIQYYIELRGIGVIDVRRMFGVEAVKMSQVIDVVLNLEHWDGKKSYNRLGLEEEYVDILGHKVPIHTIPIRPGRNLAIICEAAAVNHRQKKMGYNAAQELSDKVEDIIKNKT